MGRERERSLLPAREHVRSSPALLAEPDSGRDSTAPPALGGRWGREPPETGWPAPHLPLILFLPYIDLLLSGICEAVTSNLPGWPAAG